MSTNKRQNSVDEADEGKGESQFASSRKKLQLPSLAEPSRGRKRFKPNVIRSSGYKPPSTPMQPFRQHHQVRLVSEGARPINRNKRCSSRRRPFNKISTPFSPNSSPYSGLPEAFDVSPGLRDAVPPADDDERNLYWKAEHAAFINSNAGLGDATWVGKRPLGFGSFGTAGLWERRDENNVVLEQIVIKESKEVPVEHWGEVPEEVKMMRRMDNTKCQAVPKLTAYKRYAHVRKHRIYMEYCPYSDLYTLDLNYQRFRTYFPEPFLWHTFSNLVNVAAAMRDGPDDSNWDYQIVHRDLKPANIFLGAEDVKSGFPSYPVAKTGDWGLATKIERNDINNPLRLRGTGTDTYFAPEQRVFLSGSALKAEITKHLDGTSPLQELSAHTNIWGIGAIMIELLTHESLSYYLDGSEWTVDEVFVDIPNAGNPKYSSALTELIRLCVMPDPLDRPSIEELQLKIGARCQTIVDWYAANPSLQHKDRLYYKGSEINQMPPGNWNYWDPNGRYVPRPSDPPGPQELHNPFTDVIEYPRYPDSELDESEGKESEVSDAGGADDNDDGDDDGEDGKGGREIIGSRGDRGGKPVIVIPDDPTSDSTGNNADTQAVAPDSNAEDVGNERSGNSRGSRREPSNVIEISSGSSDDSDDSDDSDVRHRRAIKKLPGTST